LSRKPPPLALTGYPKAAGRRPPNQHRWQPPSPHQRYHRLHTYRKRLIIP